ncbi:MAG: hypothetical protein JXA73_05020 [Acidobacteria bacterium]|nr:hypothetical protein [Acidobacteriota bacterium]
MADDHSVDVKELEQQVARYREVRPVYEAFTGLLDLVLKGTTKDLGITPIIQPRTKDISSFAGKIVRRRDAYPDPVNQFTDLSGVRVIVGYKHEIEPVRNFIRRNFEIDEANSEDVIHRLGVEKFGYADVHLIVSIRNGTDFPDAREALIQGINNDRKRAEFAACLNRLHERRTEQECRELRLPPGPRFKAEIQIRTFLQHAWAECAHDRVYKSDFEVPPRNKRDINRIAAALEEADEDFVRAIRSVENYRTYYGAYLDQDQRKTERNRLDAILRYDPDNVSLAQKAARLALSDEDFAGAEEKLAPIVEAWDKSPEASELKDEASVIEEQSRKTVPDLNKVEPAERKLAGRVNRQLAVILLDYGWARWNHGHRLRDDAEKTAGRQYILWSTYLDPANIDARIAFADTFVDHPDEALEKYELAFKINAAEPRVLAGLLYYKTLRTRSLDFVSSLRPTLEAAIENCRDRAQVGIYIPYAYFNAGLFALALGRPYECLVAYSKAVQKSDFESIQKEVNRIERLQKALENKHTVTDWLYRFLLCSWAAKLIKTRGQTISEIQRSLESEQKALQNDLRSEKDPAKIQAINAKADKAIQDLSLLKKLRDATLQDRPHFDKPIIIVAGGTDESVESKIKEYDLLMTTSFEGFSGTVFGGGTKKGISGLVGKLSRPAKGSLRRVSYLRQFLPVWAQPWPNDSRGGYEMFHIDGTGFSLLEPIQTWIDLLVSDVNPRDVKLLGINGGQIAAFEYRLALTMAAQVGILGDSGRAASEIFEDEEWKDAPCLLRLPSDPQSVKVFVHGIRSPEVLEQEHRTELAKRAHEEYRKGQGKVWYSRDPAAMEWKNLPPGLQDSNLQQIAHIEEKMKAVGLKIRKAAGPVQLVDFAKPEFKDKLEIMAEMEHARWNVERLAAGWKLGPKDVEKKISPYLVSWSELPDNIKKYDRDAVIAIPRMLAEFGYEIVSREDP